MSMNKPVTIESIVEEFKEKCNQPKRKDGFTVGTMYENFDENFDEISRSLVEDWLRQSLTSLLDGIVEEIDSLHGPSGINGIPETNDYANGWNDCRKEAFESRRKVINVTIKAIKARLT